ncbi:hypothetical protein RRG08_014187 [Elysia crispata]|uniref:Uncharacterized protein n=1 Tax=Elysia crispata TaxID=231223 RepID=A0AAE0Z354_9GAST|nr:hypothetical protein RRG08_014187 [Elysia crispata]
MRFPEHVNLLQHIRQGPRNNTRSTDRSLPSLQVLERWRNQRTRRVGLMYWESLERVQATQPRVSSARVSHLYMRVISR